MDTFTSFKLRLLKIRASWDELSISKKSTLSLMVLALLVFPSAYLLSQSGINLYGRASEPITYPNPTPEPHSTPYNFRVNVSGDRVNATWNAPNNGGEVEDYIVEFRAHNDNNEQTWHIYEDGVQTAASIDVYLNDEFASSLKLDARIRAKFKGSDRLSEPSNIATYTIPPLPAHKPHPPQNFNITVGSGSIIGSWSPPDDIGRLPISDYKMEYKEEGTTNWTVFDDGVSSATTLTARADTNRTPALHLEARVRAIGKNRQISDPSDIVAYSLGRVTATPTPTVALTPTPTFPAGFVQVETPCFSIPMRVNHRAYNQRFPGQSCYPMYYYDFSVVTPSPRQVQGYLDLQPAIGRGNYLQAARSQIEEWRGRGREVKDINESFSVGGRSASRFTLNAHGNPMLHIFVDYSNSHDGSTVILIIVDSYSNDDEKSQYVKYTTDQILSHWQWK